MNHFRLLQALATLSAIFFASYQVHAEALFPIPSAWELVEMSPISTFDSELRGVSNSREIYTLDGRVCLLEPNETSAAAESCFKVSIIGDQRVITLPDGDERSSRIVELSESRMVVESPEELRFSYRRIDGKAARQPIRPESLQVVEAADGKQLSVRDIHYIDTRRLPKPRKITGVWETIEHRVERSIELPPYGFPNRKFVISTSTLARIDPQETSVEDDAKIPYQLEKGKVLVLDGQLRLDVTFNKWGDLELSGDGEIITLRQLSLDPKTIPIIPAKIALLTIQE